MNQRTAWIVYSALRLVLFAAPFALLYWIGWPWWLAAITAALVSVSLSIIFLQRPRETAAESIYEWRNRDRTEDEIVEDEIIEDVELADAGPAESGSADSAPAEADSAKSKTVESDPAGPADPDDGTASDPDDGASSDTADGTTPQAPPTDR